MPYTNINDALKRLDEIEATSAAYSHAMAVLSLDAATAGFPDFVLGGFNVYEEDMFFGEDP